PYFGYTVGPGYWGKTFFQWPPDPRLPWDPQYFPGGGANITELPSQFVAALANGGKKPLQNSKLEGVYKANTPSGSKNWPGSTGSNEWASASQMDSYIGGLAATDFPGAGNVKPTATQRAQLQRLFNRGGKQNGSTYTSPGMPKDGSNKPMPCDWRKRFFYNG